MDCKTVAMPLAYVTCMSPASSESSTSASGSELSWEVVGLEAVPDESQGSAMLVVFADEGAWLELTHGGISTMSETGVSTRIR